MLLNNPSEYKCELGNLNLCSTRHWKIRDDVNVVNGIVEKADGTFLDGFHYKEIKENGESKDLIVGSYPLL